MGFNVLTAEISKATNLFSFQETGHGALIRGLSGSFGPTALLRFGGVEILIVSIVRRILDLQQFNAFGTEAQSE